ncbi:hypothetical protein DFP72DRAFT_1072818 [Ephemerocybe angulata]|uniref:Uncharacterized protein n=1 Tax=Ephemerocybe angulata TaxID=980116 RepID=A0A8H6HMS6_9AGAR|nr:hypothetical protein DFP72DRAFT_1072818 [Tulosesus angulatus]
MPAARKKSQRAPSSPSKSPRKRAPQRCRKCPNSPLRSECPHSGRKAKASTSSGDASTSQAPEIPIDPALAALPIDPALTTQPLSPLPEVPVQGDPSVNSTCSLPLPPIASNLPSSDSTVVNASAPAVASSPAGITVGAPPSTPPQHAPTTATPTHRAYASNANPVHGMIKGVCRGNDVTSMARTRAPKSPFKNTADAQTFCEYNVRDLFSRVESLAESTNAWAYIAIQHPWSRTPFLHYTSRKLRKEAPNDVAVLHRDVSRIMSQVKRADRSRLLELVKTKDAAEEAARAAEERALRAEQEVERMKAASAQQASLSARDFVLRAVLNSMTVPPAPTVSPTPTV